MFPTAASGRAFWMIMTPGEHESVRVVAEDIFGAFMLLVNILVLLSILCSKSPLKPRIKSLVDASSVQILAESTFSVSKTCAFQLRTFLEAKSGPNNGLSTVKSSSGSPSPHKTRFRHHRCYSSYAPSFPSTLISS
ncbi:hypothetical protein BHYA_0024g00310 [Botrytis hyacinthi]|uniref:Uncharacterized protein n=1 Tax=Botrytis hyacinthi TaxID=278943 RepID=A0A4Z1GXM5_9HELO|nr:hypothetical protein BHYA_0024g00310 [Botrytis hyacinthi]